jgi:hypothetical protein
MAITVAAVATLPLIEAMASESALAQTLAGQPALTVEQQNVATLDAFMALTRQVSGRVSSRMGSDLVPLTAYAAAAPLPVVTVNAEPPARSGIQLGIAYVDHLGAHVEVLAGQLPPDGLGGDEIAVTMPQAGADQAGLHLSDRFCVSSTRGPRALPVWCARIVGLWRPLDPAEPFWGGAVPGLELWTTRYDFFKLVGLQPRAGAVAGLRYGPNQSLIGSARVGDVSRQVGLLQRDLAANPNLRLNSSLGQALDAFRKRQQAVAGAIDRVTLSVGLLALMVVALITHHLLVSQARERAELLRQGRSPVWIWNLSVVGLSGLAALATLAGLMGATLAAAAVVLSGFGLNAQWLRASDLGGITAAVVGGIGGIVLIPAELAALAVAVSRETEPRAGRQDQGRATRWRPSALARVFALGGLPKRRRGELSGTLARSQLEQRPQQHVGVAFMLALATALSVLFAVELATGPVPNLPAGTPSALHGGPEISVFVGLLAILTLAVLGWGVHFRSTTVHRRAEYATVFANGLPSTTIAESVAAEQRAVLRVALAVGVVLGAVALGVLSGQVLIGPNSSLSVASVAVVLACIVLGTVAVGRRARRLLPDEPRRPALEQGAK